VAPMPLVGIKFIRNYLFIVDNVCVGVFFENKSHIV